MNFKTDRILHLSKNTKGNDYVVGDIHGCVLTVMNALKLIGFKSDVDRLISVGDLIDRGPDNMMALKLLEQPWFYAVLGNHEALHIDKNFDSAGRNGMSWALGYHERKMQKIEADAQDEQYQQLVQKMRQLPLLIDIETEQGLVGVVHAEVSPHIRSWRLAMDIAFCTEPDKYESSKLLWGRTRSGYKMSFDGRYDEPVSGVALILCGHTVVSEPTWYGNHLNIDTGAAFGVMGRPDLHACPALTIVNLTEQNIISLPIVYGDVQKPKVSELKQPSNDHGYE
jgi:serine/threonine protein phosphatase 1